MQPISDHAKQKPLARPHPPSHPSFTEKDTVEWGSLFVGCAGGGDSLITLPMERETVNPALYSSYR